MRIVTVFIASETAQHFDHLFKVISINYFDDHSYQNIIQQKFSFTPQASTFISLFLSIIPPNASSMLKIEYFNLFYHDNNFDFQKLN
jgi:hypothetical protein